MRGTVQFRGTNWVSEAHRIVDIGKIDGARADKVIDAEGLLVDLAGGDGLSIPSCPNPSGSTRNRRARHWRNDRLVDQALSDGSRDTPCVTLGALHMEAAPA
jgi:hypothetical protein